MVTFDSSAIYITAATTLQDRIVRIDAVIAALMDTALKSAATEHITSYILDDGQTKINTMYRGTAAIFKSIQSFETLKQMYVNQVNGRMIRLVDSKNFIRYLNGR